MSQTINYSVVVHGPGLAGYGPFGGPPGFSVVDPETDVVFEEDGTLKITVAPRHTAQGVLVEKVVAFPRGAFTHVSVTRATKEA